MDKPSAGLKPQMEAVLARLCSRLGRISKTQAVKLPYLVDVVSKHRLGRSIAGGHYQCWKHGVVAEDVFRGVELSPAFTVKEERYTEASKWIELKKSVVQLRPEEVEVVDAVAEQFGSLDQDALGILTKRLNTHIPMDKWGSNALAIVNDDAYYRLDEQWQSMCERISKIDFAKLDDGAIDLSSDDALLRLVS